MDNDITNNNNNGEGIITSRTIPVDLVGEIKRAFISYSMAVIINRALPDVRDGLKPVHRRILFSMHEQGMTADKPHKKCARIVGDVLGKYHPHGDSSIYDALVRLAQDFSTRYLLIDGHGNFGSVDGDGAAAMRYTEARMSKLTEEMLRDIDKETVDYYPNFDDSLEQPVTLPSRFPNLLVNGSGGIAVGMATNIPPHNLGEIVDATIALINDPDMDVEQLMEIVPGPDFPTGGVITGYSGIRQAYRTGRGRLRVRAKCEIEEHKGHERITVTEIPYQVNKEAMVAHIRELARDKKIEGISDCVDHSDKEGMRVTIDLQKGANANVVLNQLYKHTQMQTTFGVIMLALVDGTPKVLSLKDVIAEYIKYQFEVIMRRTRYDLEKAEKRAHILIGLLKALDHIDEIIALIRSKADTPSARTGLMETFGFTEVQAQAILDMKLQRLTGLEREKIQNEYDSLLVKIAHYKAILETPSMVYDIIKEDLLDIKARYGDARRTEITPVDDEIDLDELIQEEEMVVTLTHQGYIKRTASDSYRAQRRGGRGITGLATKEEDFVKDVFVSSTHSNLLFFTTKGKVFVKKCYFIPEAGRTAKGIAIVNLLNLEADEKVSALFPVDEFREDVYLMTVTRMGVVKKTPLSEFARIRQSGLIAVNLREGDELISAILTYGDSNIIIGTSDGMAISFKEEDVRPMGRVATGVRGITLREGDRVVDACKLAENETVLVITENGYGKRTPSEEYRLQTRGGIGLKSLNVTAKTGNMIGLKVVNDEEDIMLINDANVIIRMPVSDISVFGRAAQGVRVMRVAEDTKVVGIAKLPAAEAEEETEE